MDTSAAAEAIDRTRVIGVFAHIDAGKTTTSEVILYLTGRIHRIGSVDEGSTQLDWMAQERERGITITSAATTCSWGGHRIHLIDTPGHVDFSAEVLRSIGVIDGAVVVLCGVGGVEPQSEAVWMHADRQGLPRLLFVNKLDRLGADLDRVVAMVREELTPRAAPLQVPIGREGAFCGVVDLISRRALVWRGDEPAVERVPSSLAGEVEAARGRLVDAICETDDALLEQRLQGQEPGEAALRAALRRATISRQLVPLLCGSALKRIGVQPLLDAVVDYLPTPLERAEGRGMGPVTQGAGARPGDPHGPLCAAAFKIVADPYVGHLAWVRLFSGSLRTGEAVYNPRAGAQERVSRIYRMHANRREQADEVAAGDVVALVGVRSATTGDTLCDPAHPIELEAYRFPEPVIMVALAPPADDPGGRLYQAVERLCAEDPTLVARYDPETGEETLAGMGELHLEIAVDRLRTEFGLVPRVSEPEVAYRETVQRPAEGTGTYRKQTGGHGHFARVLLRVEPLPRGEGIVFENAAPTAEIAPQFVRGAEIGVREALAKGVLAGYPATDLRVVLAGGRYHEVDSSSMDFQIAGSLAVREAFRGARPALLEPIMGADISLREEYLGGVLGYLLRCRGTVKSVKAWEGVHMVQAEVPLAEARGHATALRDLTQGRSTFMLRLIRYDIVPEVAAEAVVARRRAEGKIPER